MEEIIRSRVQLLKKYCKKVKIYYKHLFILVIDDKSKKNIRTKERR